MLIDSRYHDNILGVPVDEDCGRMSAFVVFCMMGFFPLVPGIPEYTLGRPMFEKVTVNLPGGQEFTVEEHGGSEGDKNIKRALLNGKQLKTPFFMYA